MYFIKTIFHNNNINNITNIFFIVVLFYRVVVLGIYYSVTNTCTGAYHKDACGVQWNAEGAAIGGLLLHCHTAAGKVVDTDALALGQAEDMQLTAIDAESNIGHILCAGGRVYACTGKLAEAEIVSTIGGTLRLRSLVPLKGKGLKPASGECPNPLYAPADVKKPLVSKKLDKVPSVYVDKVYEYDIETVAGKTYKVALAG